MALGAFLSSIFSTCTCYIIIGVTYTINRMLLYDAFQSLYMFYKINLISSNGKIAGVTVEKRWFSFVDYNFDTLWPIISTKA